MGMWESSNRKLKQLINDQTVRCLHEGQDRHGRTLRFTGEIDLQSEMVKSEGSSLFGVYSNRYKEEQNFAKKVKAGMECNLTF